METYKYNIQDFLNIKFQGFKCFLPKETLDIIQDLSTKVGSPNYVKTPIFEKKENKKSNTDFDFDKRKKPYKNIDSENWKSEKEKSFQITKIEQKKGIDGQIDLIRSHLNKMSDKNYLELKDKIIDILNKINYDNIDDEANINEIKIDKEDMLKVGKIIFEIASNNRFYSKLYSELYACLIEKFSIMSEIFENNFASYFDLFQNIQCGNPEENYDLFCKINKENESRKALSVFLLNSTLNGILSETKFQDMVYNLFANVLKLVNEEGKKGHVDEICENIFLLYNPKLFNVEINNLSFNQTIKKISTSKSKDYLSLSNKSIFKFMDIVDKYKL